MTTISKLRSYRVFNVAILDVGLTATGGVLLVADYLNISRPKGIIGMFLLGHFVDKVFHIETALNPAVDPEATEATETHSCRSCQRN
jgi:hypothetical protein